VSTATRPGDVDTVKVNTRDRSIEFNREVDEKRPGMRYIGTGIAAEGQFRKRDRSGRRRSVLTRSASGNRKET
jgi:hypothetical protein